MGHTPYGYRIENGKAVIDDAAAAQVRKLYKNYLPEILSFDEFKSVKSAECAISFHMVDGKTGKTIDIVEDRRLTNLIKFFS